MSLKLAGDTPLWRSAASLAGRAVAGFTVGALAAVLMLEVARGPWAPPDLERSVVSVEGALMLSRATAVAVRVEGGSVWFVTAAHAVDGGGEVQVADRPAKVVAVDLARDIALLRASGPAWTEPLRIGDDAQVDESVRAVGRHYAGLGPPLIFHRGWVAAVMDGRTIAACGGRPGMSGGAVLNDEGRMVGMVQGCLRAFDLPNLTEMIVLPASEIRAFLDENGIETEG